MLRLKYSVYFSLSSSFSFSSFGYIFSQMQKINGHHELCNGHQDLNVLQKYLNETSCSKNADFKIFKKKFCSEQSQIISNGKGKVLFKYQNWTLIYILLISNLSMFGNTQYAGVCRSRYRCYNIVTDITIGIVYKVMKIDLPSKQLIYFASTYAFENTNISKHQGSC